MSGYNRSVSNERVGLVLTGGGSRGAYQAGVLKGLIEVTKAVGVTAPFQVLTGISAGALNTTFLASHANDFEEGANRLCALWENLSPDQVFNTDAVTLGWIGLRLITDLSFGGLHKRVKSTSLLKTQPLRELIERNVPFENIQKHIESGLLHAVSVTATHYQTGISTTFVQAPESVPMWRRVKRMSERAVLKVDHVMASSAIPLFFPPVGVDGRFYGDGVLRNSTPLSPAIHLGAHKLILISVKMPKSQILPMGQETLPTPARILSTLLNSIFLDGSDVDYERLSRINETIRLLGNSQTSSSGLSPIESLWIRPSQDLGQIAKEHARELPPVLKYLIRGLGSYEEASEVISYLLFDRGYCSRLVKLGYEDALRHREQIEAFYKRSSFPTSVSSSGKG